MHSGRPSKPASCVVVFVTSILLVSLLIAGSTGGVGTAEEDRLIVHLHEDGSADFTLVLVYDLADEQDADGFTSITSDTAAQAEIRDRYEDRMIAVASDANERVDREMTVSSASIEIEQRADGSLGFVVLSVTWEHLAQVDDDVLEIDEPVTSGFIAPVELVLVLPDGYGVGELTPQPTEMTDDQLRWAADTDLSGFGVTLAPTDEIRANDGEDGSSTDALPGFGITVALGAVLGYTLWRTRRP